MKINKHSDISEYDLEVLERKAELSSVLRSVLALTQGNPGLTTVEVASVIKDIFIGQNLRSLKAQLKNNKKRRRILLKD